MRVPICEKERKNADKREPILKALDGQSEPIKRLNWADS